MKLNQYTKTMLPLTHGTIYCEYILNGKPPIILLHGFVSSTYTFNRLIPLLKENFSIIAIDFPGFGRSEKSKTFIYSYDNYAELVIECMDYFKLENAVIAGHSMGGQIALYTAEKIPQRVSKLILLASSGYLKGANNLMRYTSYLPLFSLVAKHKVQKQSVSETLKNVLYDHSLITPELIEEYKRPLKEKDFYKALVRLLRYREGDLSSERLHKIQTQSLLIWGDADKVVPLCIGKKLVEDLPNARIISYNKTGHLITEERPAEVNEQIISFTRST
ncbi:alpha/beta hydrolase [Virgibacillus sp. C22-A2]|uniref:Alpha/beta hydrolase n=1 Tax=Virgibacillus tibetensis TaxID=3042313 RepID=A0ABU6KJC6_9BACI|nr:alpha/beta hydrolase [Virgibacillus sp. C22-A2]